eukprot:9013334-Prorocentrum_lima.AAC.1
MGAPKVSAQPHSNLMENRHRWWMVSTFVHPYLHVVAKEIESSVWPTGRERMQPPLRHHHQHKRCLPLVRTF